MKIHPVVSRVVPCGKKDMSKLIAAFRNSAPTCLKNLRTVAIKTEQQHKKQHNLNIGTKTLSHE